MNMNLNVLYEQPKQYLDTLAKSAYLAYLYVNPNTKYTNYLNQSEIMNNEIPDDIVFLTLLFTTSLLSTIVISIIIANYLVPIQNDTDKIVLSNTNTNSSNDYSKPPPVYFGSIIELTKKNKIMKGKMKLNNNYFVLLRVQMKNDIPMRNTKYELYSNNIDNVKPQSFTTKDMYMIMGFNYYETDLNIASIVVRGINYLNAISPEIYRNKDFIIVAIGGMNDKKTNEFYEGLVHINYELFNVKNVNIKIKDDENSNKNNNNNNNNIVKYVLTLPIYDVYNMFMDTYNDTVFETSIYSIDKNNYEYLCGKSINGFRF